MARDALAHVLLVAANDDDREIYFTGLALEGFAVMCSGFDADITTVVRQLMPTVVVFVLEHADDEDWNRCRALRNDGATREIPIIIVTAAVRPDGANRLIARGLGNCAAFVAKPCDHRDLATVVRRVIGGQRNLEIVNCPGNFA